MRDVINFIIRGGEVTRFHTVRTIQTETNGHHSFLVATLAHLLSPSGALRGDILLAALVHDLAEHVVGDIPANTKKSIGAYHAMEQLENEYLATVGLDVNLLMSERRVLKMADVLAGYIFCKRERELGNKELSIIGARYLDYLEQLAPFSNLELEVINAITK